MVLDYRLIENLSHFEARFEQQSNFNLNFSPSPLCKCSDIVLLNLYQTHNREDAAYEANLGSGDGSHGSPYF